MIYRSYRSGGPYWLAGQTQITSLDSSLVSGKLNCFVVMVRRWAAGAPEPVFGAYSNEVCDIISFSLQGLSGDFCYIFEHLTPPNFL